MSVPKITITHADGTVSTRQSKRPYIFGIEKSPRDPARYRAYLVGMNEKLATRIVNLNVAIENPEVKIKNRGFGLGHGVDETFGGAHTFHNFEGYLVVKDIGDRWIASHCDSKGQTELSGGEGSEPILDALLRSANWYLAKHAGEIAHNAGLIDAIDAGTADLGEYSIVRWTSRLGLGMAALEEFSFYKDRGHTLTVVPVDTK